MNIRSRVFLGALLPFTLAGCAGLSEMQAPVSKFDDAAHSASTAETSFLNAEQTSECEDQFYTAAFGYSGSATSPIALSHPRKRAAPAPVVASNFDLTGSCKPVDIQPQQLAVRTSLMAALVLYADKMQSLATTNNNKSLDSAATTTAQKLDALGKAGGIVLTGGDATVEHAVEAAFVSIAEMALDQQKYDDIKKAASAMQKPLETIVGALKSENISLATSLAGHLGHVEILLRTGIVLGHNRGQLPDQIFFEIVQARNIIIAENPIAKESLAAATNGADTSASGIAKPINDTLDAVVSGNNAIVNVAPGGLSAAATDLYSRANTANAFYNGLTSAK